MLMRLGDSATPLRSGNPQLLNSHVRLIGSWGRISLEKKAHFDGVDLEYTEAGSGEPVVLIHGSILSNYLSVLQRENVLAKKYRSIAYARRGFGRSSHHTGPFSIPEQATDCRRLMDTLKIKKAHVVGHSYGGGIGIQLALDYPESVHSLSLLEPMLPQAVLSELPSSAVAEFNKAVFQIAQLYQQGNKAAAIDAFLKFVAGADLVSKLDSILPGAMEQAVKDADTFFQVELPAMQSWTFAMKQSRNIKQPILFMVGGESFFAPFADQIREITARWFLEAQGAMIPQATHAFPMTKPGEVARNLSEFFRHHPLRTAS